MKYFVVLAVLLFTGLSTAQSYEASVEPGNQSGISDNTVENVTQTENGVEFSGVIVAPTPCHSINHSVQENDSGYVLNVETVSDPNDDRVCAEVVTPKAYDTVFEADPGFELEVRHDSEKIETINHRPPRESFIRRILAFLGL